MKLFLCTAPMVQINTPYPATAYLKGFLDEQFPGGEVKATQADPALELILRLFCQKGLSRIRAALPKKHLAPELAFFAEAFEDYLATVEEAVRYLQGKNPGAQKKIAARDLLPEGPRFAGLHEGGILLDQFEALPEADKAQHLASLYLDDLADYVKLGIDPQFQFSRYGEKLAASQPSFEALRAELERAPTLVDKILLEITEEWLDKEKPDLFCLSAPFAGTVYGALRMGQAAKARNIPVALGGGYPNTELRRLEDPRVFDYVDFITIDDGERPLLCLIECLRGQRKKEDLFRTYYRAQGKVHYAVNPAERDLPFRETGTPSYEGLPIKNYIRMYEMLNPMTRLWSGFFWNKLTLAHGCYWRRCSFCDTSLDYIGRYETEKAARLVDKMEKISRETGATGFHFVDEAAPPAILRALAEELLRRNLKFEWWGNVRFDKAFTPELTQLMKRAGCIAVTGGLEVASARLLTLIEKGVTIEQVAKVTRAFQDSGIFVHAYLMYGFPTETVQETVDSLEVVRQLFSLGCLQSAFWHRFAATVHSPIGKNPQKYGIRLLETPPSLYARHGRFSENDIPFEDPLHVDHDSLGEGLKRALYNFMHAEGLERDVRDWFPLKVPKTKIPAKLIAGALQ
ncbi:MAG: radical SAM protein [Bacteriovoracia bacterium]